MVELSVHLDSSIVEGKMFCFSKIDFPFVTIVCVVGQAAL